MTTVYFVRHAQPVHPWEDDRTRPLTEQGKNDSKLVTEFFKNIEIDHFISSPYVRSYETIIDSARDRQRKIVLDERLKERKKGTDGNKFGMFEKRWSNLDYCEHGGEPIKTVQNRNIDALFEILNKYTDKNIVIGTHGTALCSILHYFNPEFCCNDFLRIIDFMPYIIKLDFRGLIPINKEELLIVKKEFNGTARADILI